MAKIVYIIFLALFFTSAFSQKGFKKIFPKSVITAQYGGSTGFLSAGFSKATLKNKLEMGILIGKVPPSFGGPVSTISVKFTYNPFHINLTKKFMLEPLQTGIFICRNFSDNLGPNWGSKYPPGYYWWTRSVRFHYFVGTQLSYKIEKKHLNRIAAYFETNTNDLYVFSYLSNRKKLNLYDIFFFGAGVKVYLQ